MLAIILWTVKVGTVPEGEILMSLVHTQCVHNITFENQSSWRVGSPSKHNDGNDMKEKLKQIDKYIWFYQLEPCI